MQKQISAIISLKDRFSKPLLKMSDNIKSLDKETRSSMNRINRWGNQVEKSVDKALKSLGKWAKRGTMLLGAVSFKKGMDGIIGLDDAARKVKSIAGDALELDHIRNELQDMQYRYGKSVTDLGDSWYDAISASVPIAEAQEAVELAHKVATAGFTDDAQAMKLLATSANAFEQQGIKNMERMANQILLTQNRGVVLVGEMSHGFGSINALSQAIGASFEEQLTAIATMTKQGMTAPEAITSYKSILNAFLNEVSDTTAGYLEEFGLGKDFLTAKTFKELGFTGAIREVVEKTDGDLDKISKIFKNIRGKTGATIFTGKGLSDMDKIYEEMTHGYKGALDYAFDIVDGSVGNQYEKLKKKLYTLNTQLWYGVDSEAGSKIQNINKWFDENQDVVENAMKTAHDWIAKVLDKLKELFEFIKENKDAIGGIIKFLASLYILRKVSKWLDDIHKSFKDIRTIFKALKKGDVAVSLLEGGGLLKIGKALLVIWAIFKFIQKMIEDWDDIKIEYPRFAEFVEWVGTDGIDHLKKFIGLIFDTIEFLKELVNFVIDNVFEFIFPTVMGWFDDLIGIVHGVFGTIIGIIKIIGGILSGNKDLIKEGWEDLTEGLGETWESFVGIVERPISSVVDLLLDGPKEKWNQFVEWVKKPISTTLSIVNKPVNDTDWKRAQNKRGRREGIRRSTSIGRNYKGTLNWRGGYTYLHERGAEIVDLPDGSRVYPHDESLDIARKEGLQLAGMGSSGQYVDLDLGGMHFYGDIKTDKDIDEIGTQIVTRIKKELSNM